MPSLDLSFTYSDAVNSHFASHCMGKPIEWYLDKETCKKCQGTEVSGQQPVRNWGQSLSPGRTKSFQNHLSYVGTGNSPSEATKEQLSWLTPQSQPWERFWRETAR
jgi:hypothetical protein